MSRGPVGLSWLAVALSLPAFAASAQGRIAFRYDQLGYPATAAKRVLVLSSGPIGARGFGVRDRGGQIVLRGRASGPVRWSPRWRLYSLDLSRLRRDGVYAVSFAGVRSPAIRVGTAGLYRPLVAGSVAFLQTQRDGAEVLPGRLHRVASHLRDASALLYAPPVYRGQRLARPLATEGARVDASGGWFDAGDYLKFVETASFTDASLLFALRTYPAGIADTGALAAEARFGADWLLKMWDQSSRVLYYQVGIGEGNGSSVLGDHDLWRLPQADEARAAPPGSPAYFESYRPVFAANAPNAPISPNLAGRLAAAFALCAQVFRASDPAYAQRCLLAGQTVYDQADTSPRGALLSTSPGSFYNETEWRDDMEFGATELYLATQQALEAGATTGLVHSDLAYYLQQAGAWANAYIEARGSGEDSLNLYDVSTLADYDLIAILRTPLAAQLEARPGVEVPTDPASLLRDRSDQLRLARRLARREPFGLANPSTNLDTVAHALGYAVQARMYDRLSGTGAYATFAQRQLDWVLGANAWGSSFVVGYGRVFPHCLASQIPNLAGSLSGRGAIDRGATVNGPTAPADVARLELPEGARRCSAGGSAPFRVFDGRREAYRDDVRSSSTSEPTDDLAALTLLAAAQATAR